MTPDQRLAQIFRSLSEAGIDVVVMGGHAVRYYGIDRNTIDFDLATAVATADELRRRLPTIPSLGFIREEPVWRGRDFARYEVGKLPDGREEWLEFWLRNHLLANFTDLKARAEIGDYGGELIRFLGLTDLMRSKETERESDWQDIALLEEIRDDRNRVAVPSGPGGLLKFLSSLRSRRGMDFAVQQHLTDDRESVVTALMNCTHPVTCAFLHPFAQDQSTPSLISPINSAILASVAPASSKHFAVIEIVRREYKRNAMDRDRADKQKQLRKE